MKRIFLLFAILVVAFTKYAPHSMAQNDLGAWIGDTYDVNGLPYVWTSVYDDDVFWSLQVAYSHYWGMMFAMHIQGEYIRIWQPNITFGDDYVVKPDEFDGKLTYLQTPNQSNLLP